MSVRLVSLAIGLMILVGGCATGPLPGGAGDVSGPLRSIELYTKRPTSVEELYPTAARERFFASDREVYVVLHWALPGPGDYVSKVVLRTPAGSVYREYGYRFRAEASSWSTGRPVELPQAEAAQPLAGRWQVEVALDATPVGKRTFTFDPSNIRLRTDARLLIAEGTADSEAATTSIRGDWIWINRYAALEVLNAALARLGGVLRNELTRRFPHVDGPQRTQETSDATVLLTPTLLLSPNPDVDSRLHLEAVHVSTKAVRKFHFSTSAGTKDQMRFGLAPVDLAIQAASSPELLEFLTTATQAVPE